MNALAASRADDRSPRVSASALLRRLLFEDFEAFMGHLVDEDGDRLTIARHHQDWCDLLQQEARLVLCAPRDHSKTTSLLAYVLWRFFRHGVNPLNGRLKGASAGAFQAVLMSATRDQANVLMARFRALAHANAWLFTEARLGTTEPYWIERESDVQLRLRTGAELLIRSFRTSTRGLHPDLLVLDDVLSDENSGTDHQRRLTYRYFTTTLLPMHPGQLIVVGTALHQADLLHRLKPTPTGPVHGFAWRRYRAMDEAGRTALWPERHPYDELARLRDADPTVFSREYQNLPTDERSTFFPSEMTQQAITRGARLTLLPFYRPRPTEVMIMGADLARSERIGADYTVALVVAYDLLTCERRLIAVRRERGLDFEAQISMFTGLAVNYGLLAAYIESNGFQRWLVDELRKRPGGHVFFGDSTGRGRMSLDQDGIPILAHALRQDRWLIPSGNEESREFARTWQAELGAFGWRNGRVEGVGEHDDIVMACWFIERLIAMIERLRAAQPDDEIVTIEDLIPGWKRVKIGSDD